MVNTTNYLNAPLKSATNSIGFRVVFEPLIVHAHGDRNMLELVTDDPSEALTLTYKQGSEKCNQLLNLLRKQGVQQGDDVFIMCGLNEGLWISYLSAIKGGIILIPAASILTVNDIVYRFQKASRKLLSQIRIMQKKWTRLYYNTIILSK
jgi:acyl-coenzyme A synthetase/AMP-(fatty) acid ligase